MNKYFEIIYHLDKEIQIKWWLLKHYRSLINKIIALKQTTPLTIIGTILHKLLKIIIYGKTYQNTTPSDNLQKFTVKEFPMGNYSCNNIGQVTITGTVESDVAPSYNSPSIDPITLESGTYTIKVVGTISENTSFKINALQSITLDSNQEATLQLSGAYSIYISINAGEHNDDFYITLAKGTTATTERYTGEVPNPNYPQEIKNVEGKNKFNKNTVVDGAILYSNGTIASESNYKSSDYIEVKPNNNYYINYSMSSSYYGIAFYNKDKQYISGNALSNAITTPNNCSYLRFAMRVIGSAQIADINTIQLEEGSVATEYLPYNSIGVKVQNKNWFDTDKTPTKLSNTSVQKITDGIKVITNLSSGYTSTGYVITDLKKYVGKTVRFKANWVVSGNNIPNYYLRLSDANGNNEINKGGSGGVSGAEISFVVPEFADNITYLYVLLYANVGGNCNVGDYVEYKNIMLTIDDDDMTYVPHAEQTCPFTFEEGQYLAEGGYLADDGIHNVYAQKSLNGTEDWRSAGTAGQYYAYYLQVSDMKSVGSISSNNFWCDSIHFVSSSSYAEEGGGYLIQRNFVIFSSETSVNDFKTWLSNHNMILQYELADPQPIPYTQTQQEQWNAIKEMYTYKDQTNIDVLANLDGIEIDIGYYSTEVLSQETLEELSNGRGD